jgi:alpha-tubulin suppressor-like RCC1 family protein
VAVAATNHWTSFAAGRQIIIAVDDQNQVYEWGRVPFGLDELSFRPSAGAGSWRGASMAYGAAGVRQDGTLWTWGRDQFEPTLLDTNRIWNKVSGGHLDLLAIATDGTLWAAGPNYYGELGTGRHGGTNNLVQVESAKWAQIETTGYSTAGIQQDGSLWVWGGDAQKWLNAPDPVESPSQFGTDTDWVSVSLGSSFGLALKQNGALWAWGDNSWGQLGITNTQRFSQPFAIVGRWTAASGGFFHTVAIRDDGTLWTWGQFAGGAVINIISPTQVGSETNWVAVSAGSDFSSAIKADGSLWVWGSIRPDARTSFADSPVLVPGGKRWVSLSHYAEGVALLAIQDDGSLWGIGSNWEWDLGLGDAPVVFPRKVEFGP